MCKQIQRRRHQWTHGAVRQRIAGIIQPFGRGIGPCACTCEPQALQLICIVQHQSSVPEQSCPVPHPPPQLPVHPGPAAQQPPMPGLNAGLMQHTPLIAQAAPSFSFFAKTRTGSLRPSTTSLSIITSSTPSNEGRRSEEHTSELQSLMRNSYAVFCLKKKTYD